MKLPASPTRKRKFGLCHTTSDAAVSHTIVYKSTDWWEALRHLGSSGIIRLLFKRVLWGGLYATAVTAGAVHFNLLDTYQYLTIPITMFGAYALLGVEMIGDEIEDPFGKDSNDLPLTQLSNRIRANVHEILGVDLHGDYRALADVPYSLVF